MSSSTTGAANYSSLGGFGCSYVLWVSPPSEISPKMSMTLPRRLVLGSNAGVLMLFISENIPVSPSNVS